MHRKSLALGATIGSAVTLVLAIGGTIWVVKQVEGEPVQWPSKTFYDDKDTRPDSGYIALQGALYGEDMAGGTFLHIECNRADATCQMSELSQYHSAGRSITFFSDSIPIKSWGDDVVIAESQPAPRVCNKVRLVIVRGSDTAQYVRIPQATGDKEMCKVMARKTFTWDIGERE